MSTDNPLVSVLIPLYNSEAYISEAIQSCLNQTYPNIEIIIVDDGSTDNSYQKAKTFEGQRGLRIYRQENKGACVARNFALEMSVGDYFQYLDADDLLVPDKIEKQMKLFEQYGNDIIVSGIWGRFYNSIDDVKWEDQLINKNYENPIEWLVDSWNGKGMGQTSIWLTPRKLIERAGKWDETLTINQDGEFFCRVLLKAKAIKFCGEAKVFYRSGIKSSISQQKRSKAKLDSLKRSFDSYVNQTKGKEARWLKKGLARNYMTVAIDAYPIYKDLSIEALNKANALYDVNQVELPVFGGRVIEFVKNNFSWKLARICAHYYRMLRYQ